MKNTITQRNAEVVAALVKWWQENNFVVMSDERPKENWVSVDNRADGFGISVQERSQGVCRWGRLLLVWPNGKPAPRK
ncbi:hypothetical protein [Actinocrispum sp. NPDC049592]|uniref:hypothetical protein n=1 Tax=Actinocrispum sp. NPDC049592 TaxID=3154835 RepID=UPI003427515A